MGLPGLDRDHTLWLDFAPAGFDAQGLALFAAEVDEFESALGCHVRLGPREHAEDAAWVVAPSTEEEPSLTWDCPTLTLTSHANGPEQTSDSLQLLHALLRHPETRPVFRAPDTSQSAAYLICDEVLGTYPYFDLRAIDRDRWANQVDEAPSDWDEFTTWAQEWVAQLGDAHTAVINLHQRGFNPAYIGSFTPAGIVLETVPAGTPAHAAGVGAGWVVEVDDPGYWLRTTGASPQQHARVAARRALTMAGDQREFLAREPGTGRTASWVEAAHVPSLDDVLDITMAGNVVRMRLSAFIAGVGIEDAFDEVCRDAQPEQVLELDLRGNSGGNLVLAVGLRDRFLRMRTRIGSIAFSDGCGGLAPSRERWSQPSERPCWPGRLRILVDSMTYSAAEDFILGLQGLDHVTVVGERTGGGSGRPLTRPLGPGLLLRVSTAVTYDRQGRPVELFGISTDEP